MENQIYFRSTRLHHDHESSPSHALRKTQRTATSPIKALTPAPLMAIEVRLSKPWVIPMPEGEFMLDDIQSAIDMGEVYIKSCQRRATGGGFFKRTVLKEASR